MAKSITGDTPDQDGDTLGSLAGAVAVLLLLSVLVLMLVAAARPNPSPSPRRGSTTHEQPAPCDNNCRWVSDES